jgi:heptosyltransferase-1
MRVLVVKMSSMGDVVHAQPVVADLHAHIPGVAIDWVCEKPFVPIPSMNPGVNRVIPIALRAWRKNLGDASARAAMSDFLSTLRQTRYDWVIDCQGLIKSAAVALASRHDHLAGPSWTSAREPIASLAYDRRALAHWSMPVVARNRAIAAGALGYAIAPDSRASFGLVAPDCRPPSLAPGRRYAVLAPGASREGKLWADANWLEVARDLSARGLVLVWLWGGAAEYTRVAALAAGCGSVLDEASPGASLSIALVGTAAATTAATTQADLQALPPSSSLGAESIIPPFLSVADAAGLLARAEIVIGLDTGFTHLAAALGRPTVGIYCDSDSVHWAVSGDGPCASFGGVGQPPAAGTVRDAIKGMLR